MKLRSICLLPLLVACATTEVKNLSKPATPPDIIIPVTKNDLQILNGASKILSEEAKWDRNDNRECPSNASKFSLYCALYKASIDVHGVFDHRSAALEEVRRAVEDASKSKNYEHRLMGYNNDLTTRFQDVKQVLVVTEKRLEKRLQDERGL